jgi:hypothetical protein
LSNQPTGSTSASFIFFFVFLWSKGLILGGASAILSQV